MRSIAADLVEGFPKEIRSVYVECDVSAADAASGRLRLVEYLQPYDPLYFAAGGKSVSISDYSLTLTRLP